MDLTNQKYKDFEVFVVDGKSEDKTVEIAQKFAKEMNLHVLKSSMRNVSYQRNIGAKRAKGEWFLFMDADDRLPDYFLDGVRYRIAQTGADIFTTWCDTDSTRTADKLVVQGINAGLEIGQFFEMPGAWGAMIGIKKSGFQRIGGFDEKHIPFEDKKFVRIAVKKGLKFEIFRDPKYIFSTRRHRSSGHLKTMQKYIQMSLQEVTKPNGKKVQEYQMGGHNFKEMKRN